MKVLQIINSLETGGAEKLLVDTIPLYREAGIEMDLLVLNGKENPFNEELKKLHCCKVFSLGGRSVYNPLKVIKLSPFLKKYDIAHVHLFPAQYWVVLAKIISFSKVKLIFTEHNTGNRRMENQVFRFLDRLIYKRYNKVICITKEIKTILQKHACLEPSIFSVIENGVNLTAIKEANPILKNEINTKIRSTDSIILQVSRFREQKDQSTLIKALQYLPDTFKLVLIGDGGLRKKCEVLTENLQLENRVFFLGLRMDVPKLLKTADIIVLSSKYEGLSLSSIEGMASGRPFVASDVAGLSSIVKDAGILFEQGNSKELAEIIKKLLKNKGYYNFVVSACQSRAEQYEINKMVDKHIALYEDIYLS